MLILCKEYDKYHDHPPAYYIVTNQVTDTTIQILSLRSRANPELNYYATNLDKTMPEDEVLNLFKSQHKHKEPLFVAL